MADNKPVLVIMAAGMGSRYGGLKQIEPMDEQGHIIMDFSLYDAALAGFEEVIFIIKKENEAVFRERIGDRAARSMKVSYAFQELDDIPEGMKVPEGRVKPWGTGHAVLAARKLIHGPFAVINADDYYGREAFANMYAFLEQSKEDGDKLHAAMVSYILRNTLTENGHVARGVCVVDEEGYLQDIVERTKIMRRNGEPAFTEDDGESWTPLDENTPVSMNFWGFPLGFMTKLEKAFPLFFKTQVPVNPQKSEFFLPFAVDDLLKDNKADVKVLHTQDRWYGVTYREDKAVVTQAFEKMEKDGIYPAVF